MTSAALQFDLPRRRFTIKEYRRMVDAGILREDDRIELIEGEIIEMSPIRERHAAGVTDLTQAFYAGLIGRAIINVQSPVQLPPRSEPEPDLAVLRLREDRYRTGLPQRDDVLLLIEVSDTTLAYDRGIKLTMYARARIPEVWIWDVKGRRVFVNRGPRNGAYQEVSIVTEGSISPLAFPDFAVHLKDIFG